MPIPDPRRGSRGPPKGRLGEGAIAQGLPEVGDRTRKAAPVAKADLISSAVAAMLTQRANSDVEGAAYVSATIVKVAARDPREPDAFSWHRRASPHALYRG